MIRPTYVAILFGTCSLLAGCGQSGRREELGNGYYTVTRQISDKSSVFKILRRYSDGEDLLVTQAHVEDGNVQTFLPTPFAYGCTGMGAATSSSTTATVTWGGLGDHTQTIQIRIEGTGKWSMLGKPITPESVEQLLAIHSKSVVFVTMDLPITLRTLKHISRICAGSPNVHGFVLIPAERQIKPDEIEIDDSPDSELELVDPQVD